MKKISLIISTFFIAISAFAQIDEVKLIVSGTASTKEKATSIALRSAIEQAFGTFVSANTEIVNDNLIKDEIVTISSGNIRQYKELSSILLPNHQYSITLEAVVSVKKLTTFAKSHGSSCELAGNVFTENMRLKELNKRNEEKALEHLKKQLRLIEENLFDIEVVAGEPTLFNNNAIQQKQRELAFLSGNTSPAPAADNNTYYSVPLKLILKSTENSDAYLDLYFSTLNSLRLSEQEIDDYKQTNLTRHQMKVISFEEHNENYGTPINDNFGRPTKNKVLYDGTFRTSKFPALRPYRQLEKIFIKFNGITNTISEDNFANQLCLGTLRGTKRIDYDNHLQVTNTDYTQIPISARSKNKYGSSIGFYLPILSTFDALYNYKILEHMRMAEIWAYYHKYQTYNVPLSNTVYGRLANFENDHRYSNIINYKNLSAYKTIEDNDKPKKNSKKNSTIPKTGQYITSLEYEIIFTAEELAKLTGFEIIYK